MFHERGSHAPRSQLVVMECGRPEASGFGPLTVFVHLLTIEIQ